MNLIKNITNNFNTKKKAALYYKTEPFSVGISYDHTNNWEIVRSVELLNERGFSVDVIDRNNYDWTPSEKFDLFLGLGVGNAGRNFVKHAGSSRSPVSVLLAMGAEPDISNSLVLKRYEMFEKRTGIKAPPMRTSEVAGDSFKKIINKTDYIFSIGEKNNNSYNSFLSYEKPILNFLPSSSPSVIYNPEWLNSRKRNSFLCFAGNGLICKGVDLVTEAFLMSPSKTLHICGPPTEEAFFKCYQEKIKNSKNIKYHGFIPPGGEEFNSLAAECSFVVFHSAAEGCCTSVATAMRAGIVPIINSWTGINIEDFILNEDGNLIEEINATTNTASALSNEIYLHLVNKTLDKALLFSQESFSKSYSRALDQLIYENNL